MDDVSLAIVTRDGRFLLLKRSDTDPSHPGRWALPGGHCEPGEAPVDGLVRELKEETDLDCKPEFCKLLSTVNQDGKRLHIFWCIKTKGDVQLKDGEHSEYVWCSADASTMYNPIKRITETFKLLEERGILS